MLHQLTSHKLSRKPNGNQNSNAKNPDRFEGQCTRMASSSSTAESISQVSRESVSVGLKGCVQTVFPIHACMPPTANNETQDYGTVGSDGPIEGATKVFQVTLRDLSVSSGGLHRINAYFYDKWADDYSGVGLGDELTVSGPAASLVYPDPSAEAGDHPFCLVFYAEGGEGEGGDPMLAPSRASAATLAGGSGADEAGDGVACSVVTPAGRAGRDEPAARRERGQAQGAAGSGRGGRDGGAGGAKGGYTYTNLASLRAPEAKANVYGVVCSFSHRHQSRGRDATTSVSLLDETCTKSDNAVPCNFFSSSWDKLPAPAMVGDIVRIHRAKVQEYRGRPQLVGSYSVSWLVIRKKKVVREAFQKGLPIGSGGGGGGGSGSVGDDDVDPFEDSPASGPDAGGGETDSVLSSAVWEVQASSGTYTMSQVDHDRCNALDAWFQSHAPRLWLKQSSESQMRVQDIFRRPVQGEVATELEVDLICCLASKHEDSGGGAGSLLNVYVADGTGFPASRTPSAVVNRRDAALQKGMRAALGKPDWSPGNPHPSPFPAYLKVDVLANKKEWESLNLSPGMWIRLRRLTITKNRDTSFMSAKMKQGTSSVNPLHPSMAEVQTIAISHASRCASANPDAGSPTPPTGGAGNESAQDARRANDDVPAPGPAPGPASSPASASIRESVAGIGGRGSGGPQDSGLDGGGVSSAPPERGRREASSRPPVEEGASQQEQGTHRPDSRAGSQPERKEAGGGEGASGGTAVAAARGVVSGCPAGGGGGESGDASRRGTKRALPPAGVEGAEQGSVAPASCGPLSNLGAVRRKAAPEAFDTRVRIIAHFPSNVENFVRQGPEPGDGPRFLFMLRLEDDDGVVDAVAAGVDASQLLPGSPSPEEFYRSEEVRGRVQRTLERLESEGGGMWGLRLRSYLTPTESGGRGGGSDCRTPVCCKRYSIVAPSSLEEGLQEGNAYVDR